MSRKKAARAKKDNIKKQVQNAAEGTETTKAQETAGQAATGEIPSPDVQTEAETAESETEVKEAAETAEEAEPKEAEKIEEKAEPEEAEKIEEKAEPKESEKIEEKAESRESEKIEEKAELEAAEKAAPVEEKKAASELTEEEKNRQEEEYKRRFQRHFDELKWLYTEVYGNDSMFAELCDNLHRFYEERNLDLKESDLRREENPDWYKQNDMLGMMLYIDNFAGDIKGVESRLDYLEKSNVNYIHLMPFLDTTKGRSDGGYAVSDFRKVQENLGQPKITFVTGLCS